MTDQSCATRFAVPQAPELVTSAISNVRGWWSEEITGRTTAMGDRFSHTVLDLHRCELAVTEIAPEKVAWTVLDKYFSFTRDPAEWTGTDIMFSIARIGEVTEVRFTHHGLVPECECWDACQDGWSCYMASLRDLIITGSGRPNVGAVKSDSEVAPDHARQTEISTG